MIVDVNDFENDGMNEEDNFSMAGFIKRYKPQTMITSDFSIRIPPRDPGTDILFIAYDANA